MLKRMIERNDEGRPASKHDDRPGLSNHHSRDSLLDFIDGVPQQNVSQEKPSRHVAAHNRFQADGQGSFLNALGAASIDSQRQRELVQTTQRVENELRMAERENEPIVAPPMDFREPNDPRYQSAPVSRPDHRISEEEYYRRHGAPAYRERPGAAEYYATDVPPYGHDRMRGYDDYPRQPEQPARPAATASPVEQQLDMLSEKLEGVRSRHQQRQAPPAAPPQPTPPHAMPPRQAPDYGSMPSMGGGNGVAAESPFSIGNIIGAVTRTWKWIVLGTIAGMSIGAVYAISLPNEFESIADILIEPRGLKVLDDTVAPNTLNSEATVAYAESQLSIMRSHSVLDPVITQLKLDKDPEFTGKLKEAPGVFEFLGFGGKSGGKTGSDRELARQHLLENMWISRTNQTFVISVGVTTRVPEKSRDIANAVAHSYIKDESGAQSSAARNASQDLEGQLPALRQRVEDSEKEVEQHKRENNLVSLGDQSVNQAQLARLTDQMAIAMVQTGDMRVRAQIAEKADLSNVISGALPSSLNSPELKRLRAQYSSVQTGIKRLAVKLGAKHPKRIAAQAELSGIQDAIRQEIERVVRSAEEEYSRAQARESELKAQIVVQEQKLTEESGATIKLRELELKAKSDRALYEKFFARSRETGELENIRSESARLLSPAVASIQKIGPNRKFIVASSGVFGGGTLGFLALIPFVIGGLRQMIAGLTHPHPSPHQQQHSAPAQMPPPSYQDGDLYSTQAPHQGQPIYSDWNQRG